MNPNHVIKKDRKRKKIPSKSSDFEKISELENMMRTTGRCPRFFVIDLILNLKVKEKEGEIENLNVHFSEQDIYIEWLFPNSILGISKQIQILNKHTMQKIREILDHFDKIENYNEFLNAKACISYLAKQKKLCRFYEPILDIPLNPEPFGICMHHDLYKEEGMVYNCLGFEPYPMYCPIHSRLSESERNKLKKALSKVEEEYI